MRVAEARAALEMARADGRGTEKMASRMEEAADADALPRTEAIDARRARDRAAAAVERSSAALNAAEIQQEFTELTSPIAGVGGCGA